VDAWNFDILCSGETVSKRILTIISLGLVITGCLLLGNGVLIRLKPLAAQYLLAHAWKESQLKREPVKPWPWADSWPVGRIWAEGGKIDLIILEGDSGEVLAFGPGHLSISSLPGMEGHCILAGHRDTSFSFLQRLVIGDSLVLEGIDGNQTKYMVESTMVKRADELYFDGDVEGKLTLITCYPFSAVMPGGEERYIVFAKEI